MELVDEPKYQPFGRFIRTEFITINPDEENFNERKTINEIYRHVKKSNKKLTEELTKKSLIDNLSRRLLELEFEENHSIIFRALKFIVKKILPSLQNMQTYCLGWKKHTDNIGSKKVTMKNKVIREKSGCANCMSDKSRFLKNKIKRVSGTILILNF